MRVRLQRRFEDLIESQTNPTIAPYAKTGEVHFALPPRARMRRNVRNSSNLLSKNLRQDSEETFLRQEESKSLEEAVVDMLKEQEMTLSLAESCTGGAIAARIVNVSGASEVFLQGMVTLQ